MTGRIFKIPRQPFLGEMVNSSHDQLVESLCVAVLSGSQQQAKTLERQLRGPEPRRCAPPREPRVRAWFDGACRNNPGGHSSYGVVIKHDGQIIFSAAEYLGQGPHLTNNVAEYAGMIAVLRFLTEQKIQWATIYGDSQLVIKQLQGTRKAKRGKYLPYYHEARGLLARLPQARLKWISRGENTEADRLAGEGLRRWILNLQ